MQSVGSNIALIIHSFPLASKVGLLLQLFINIIVPLLTLDWGLWVCSLVVVILKRVVVALLVRMPVMRERVAVSLWKAVDIIVIEVLVVPGLHTVLPTR